MTMDCREVRRLLDAFVSEQLSVETTHAIVAHLDGCPGCRAEVEGLRRMRTTMRRAFEAAPGLQMRPEFAATLAAKVQAAGTAPQSRRWFSRHWLTLAATLVIVTGGAGFGAWSSARLRELLHAAVGDHQNCALTFALAERPIPLADAVRYDQVNQALQSVMPAAATLPGGPVQVLERHSCVYDGRRFAHIVLRYKGEAVSVLVAADSRPGAGVWFAGPPRDGRLADVQTIDGMRVTAFYQSQHSAFVVSSLSADDLRAVAATIVEPVSRALAGA